jgi:hypothetical protein
MVPVRCVRPLQAGNIDVYRRLGLCSADVGASVILT